MTAAIDVIEIYPRTAPAIGGITGAAFTALTGRVDDIEAVFADDGISALAEVGFGHGIWCQDASDTVSTTDTTNYSQALSYSFDLPDVPTGASWTIRVVAMCDLKHSGSSTSHLRVKIAGNAGTAKSAALTSSAYRTVRAIHTVTGVTAGTKVVLVEFKSNAAGTTTADNPAMILVYVRE